jgi:methylmalonyl-CoA mutase N-terminal domain/subunit
MSCSTAQDNKALHQPAMPRELDSWRYNATPDSRFDSETAVTLEHTQDLNVNLIRTASEGVEASHTDSRFDPETAVTLEDTQDPNVNLNRTASEGVEASHIRF